jgi:hypothetical protein
MEGFSKNQGSTLNNQIIQDAALFFSYPPNKSRNQNGYEIKA